MVILLYKILNLNNSEIEYKLPFKDLDIPFSSEINFFTGTLKYENNNWSVTNEYDKRLEVIEKELFVLNLDEIEIINNNTLLNESEISIISNIVVNNNINTCNHITNISNELIGNIIDIIDLDDIVNNIDTSLEIISNKVNVNAASILSIIDNVNSSNLHFKDKILNLEIGSNNLIDDITINSMEILRIENKIDDVETDLLNKIILEKENLKIDISDSNTELSNILSTTIELNIINNSNYCDKLNNNISNYIENISEHLLDEITTNYLFDMRRSNLIINSNIIITSYINNTSNSIIDLVNHNNDNIIDYIDNIDLNIVAKINLSSNNLIDYIEDLNLINYIEASNLTISNISSLSNNLIENLSNTSNELNEKIDNTSNKLITYINLYDILTNQDNNTNIEKLYEASNLLNEKIIESSNNLINYTNLFDYITNEDNTSNIQNLYEASNLLNEKIIESSNSLINYINFLYYLYYLGLLLNQISLHN